MTRRKTLVFAATLAALARGGDAWAQEAAPRATTVTVAEVRVTDLERKVSSSGTVMPIEAADLYAKVGGYLGEVLADIGDEVEKGEPLARLSVPEMDLEFAEAEAMVALAAARAAQAAAAEAEAEAKVGAAAAAIERARAELRGEEAMVTLREIELDRWRALVEGNPSIERRKIDEAESQLAEAEAARDVGRAGVSAAEARRSEAAAARERARADAAVAAAEEKVAAARRDRVAALLAYGEIVAPFDGVVTMRFAHPGAFIQPAEKNSAATPVFSIARVDRLRVAIDVSIDAVSSLDVGDKVVLDRFAAAPGARVEGAVARVSGALDERSRMMRVEAEIENPKDSRGRRRIVPGDYCRATIALETLTQARCVPARAVHPDGDRRVVWVVENGVAKRREIEPRYEDGTIVGVVSGLEAGELVIVAGAAGIAEGERVSTTAAAGGANR